MEEFQMNDNLFLTHFEDASLHSFPHADHIRMAWLYLKRDGWGNGYAHIQNGLRHFATAHHQPDKYHETITHFWASLVQHCIEHQPDIDDFATFAETFPILFDKDAIKRHYSSDVLWDETARDEWVTPDLIPMP
jgi:hypothetical protein